MEEYTEDININTEEHTKKYTYIEKERKLIILSWNMCSYRKYKVYLQKMIAELEPDVVCIQEPNHSKKLNIKITGYTVHATTEYSQHHNIITYFKKGIKITPVTENGTFIHPMNAFRINLPHVPTQYTITNLYARHDRDLDGPAIEHILATNPR